MAATTTALITDYDRRITTRWVRCQLGSSRDVARQRRIGAIVSEISVRADNGDADALAWYDR